ncbi:hypothetical protein AB0J86_19795 [Micromonospora sp. NPDC049559]|uniref:hypothetical protein n=1 Tax=Micromonospora sp. NPDC049559 TaxID=3155923 RepID=UPI003429A81C
MFTRPSHEIEIRSLTRNLVRGLALVGGVALAGVLALAAPASARPNEQVSGVRVAAMPVAARDVAPGAVAAAITPTITPAAARIRYVTNPAATPCPSGNLCAFVRDPTRPGYYKVFDLYTCALYYLSYWQNTGYYNNAQTGGVRVTFYGQSGNVLKTFTATGFGTQNWDPVWRIRNC